MTDWFRVDTDGLSKLLLRHGKAWVVFELLQNAWDTGAKRVQASLTPVDGRPLARLEVEDDDPNGFVDLSHAFTLFAESTKKDDPTKRGRFNLGEKLVLALCAASGQPALIESTKGGVRFDPDGRHTTRVPRTAGSKFTGYIKLTRAELADIEAEVKKLLPPAGIHTTFNGTVLKARVPVATFESFHQTEISDPEGCLHRVVRKTTIQVYEPLPGETPTLYELGLPVVETGDRWHVNVGQKVPLNLERDNVPPAFLRSIRVAVANVVHDLLDQEAAASTWAKEALGDRRIQEEAARTIVTLRFGDKVVIADPSNTEANGRAVSAGYRVISGGCLSADEWATVKRHDLVLPAGQVFPTGLEGLGKVETVKPEWDRTVRYCRRLGRALLDLDLEVVVNNNPGGRILASFGGHTLTLNVGRLGEDWFARPLSDPEVNRLLIHEFGHYYSDDHLSAAYHDALCLLGAKLAALVANDPTVWE